MKISRFQSLLAACCVVSASLAACSFPTRPAIPNPTSTELLTLATIIPTQTATAVPPTPTATSLPASPTPVEYPVKFPQPGTVVLDFVALACRARWVNGAVDLPCPGKLDDLAEGFIQPAYQASAEGEVGVDAPVLIGLPGLGGVHGAGLFGIYPPLEIQSGDTFYASAACQENSSCDVEFALEYIDSHGNYQHEQGWSWSHQYGGGAFPVQVDLTPLVGQTVQLVLVVRDQGSPEDDWVLWIYPYIAHTLP